MNAPSLPMLSLPLNCAALPGHPELAYYPLSELAAYGFHRVRRLPVCLRIVLESLLRHYDGRAVSLSHIAALADWQAQGARSAEIPLFVSRVVLQDFTGVPLLADLAAMRDLAKANDHPPTAVEPLVPVDLVVDHSVMVDHFGHEKALDLNMRLEFQRNRERYQFMKWGTQAFANFRVVPPGVGIVHQVNLEHLAPGVHVRENIVFPDSLVGTDSHTTMINGIGVVGWGVGGIEAEAAMLGQPVAFLTPDVVGVELSGKLRPGVTATDLVLTLTELLRHAKVVGKFVEFHGIGAASLSIPDRATIANMAPEYGATMGFFPVDDVTTNYLRQTGRPEASVMLFADYFKEQEMFGMPEAGELEYTQLIRLDLGSIEPSVAGPRRPQDRTPLNRLPQDFRHLLAAPESENGFGKHPDELTTRYDLGGGDSIGHGDVLIAAITSCTNTSNPSVMIAAGLLAEKAVAKGLQVNGMIKTSLAPGSRAVTDYLERLGLLKPLSQLGFHVAAYGCTTCIGNSGDLARELNDAITEHQLVCTAVLSGNRNFEARIHPNLRANYLASPPLVVAFALAGNVCHDFERSPLGYDADGHPVYLADIWPSPQEIADRLDAAGDPERYREVYAHAGSANDLWHGIGGGQGLNYDWPESTYIARPPFLDDFALHTTPPAGVFGAHILAILGDSVTTDHISPAGNIAKDSPAGQWLQTHGVTPANFNSYGARRGHHEVMVRGTFANVRLQNRVLPLGSDGRRLEGGYTRYFPEAGAPVMSIHAAAMRYMAAKLPTVIFAGEEYGTGSSRDWAAKGTRLLGVRAVIAKSFERIHRANLVGMGVLPLQLATEDSAQSLGLTGEERIDLLGLEDLHPGKRILLRIHHVDGRCDECLTSLRIDTPVELAYYLHGGILPYVLRQLLH